ncbi:stage II sporulation protein P [Lachnoclostridium sp. An169]|uniref:stage II sporulation protein P n=1 Tax=Lachnoclostridium sp. An169 TaxID=1965569 RepID=UPI000B3B0674|nr:stage II sporulation protein P [Lachnoclostridium sp. An169]OUP84814.1 stage II sporulation protein P [Lachnoclostridium sp. An169]
MKSRSGQAAAAAAAVFLAAGLIYLAAKGAAGEWKYEIQQRILQSAEEMYMPGLASLNREPAVGVTEWLREKALAWIPLAAYVEDHAPGETALEDEETIAKILESQANDENMVDENGQLVGEPDESEAEAAASPAAPSIDMSIEKLRDFDYLLSNFYTVDSSTMIGADQLNADDLLGRSMKIDQSTGGPKVLIYHTHSQETFVDSVDGDPSTSIVGVGDYLTRLLNERGIETIHDTGVYDIIDGKLDRSNAYQYAETAVTQILSDNPTIEVVIDLHRDGVADTTHLVTEINGKQTARIMFFNGLSRSRTNGDIGYLYNPYIQDNLAFSLQMQLAAETSYPGFTRHIYLKSYRYNMHLMPKSLLVEAGAQTNTVEEMMNAMEVLADVLTNVISG